MSIENLTTGTNTTIYLNGGWPTGTNAEITVNVGVRSGTNVRLNLHTNSGGSGAGTFTLHGLELLP
ncbi:MAG: hypothetical protein HC828_07740 [Blastochloris sp.]|nr:hypothetical protein [Blastochloris sp.]